MGKALGYAGFRLEGGTALAVAVRADHCSSLPLRLDVRNHSPSGFEWGYGGSGPAQLALAILCDVTGDPDAAAKLYERFKLAVIARLPQAWWFLYRDSVEAWIMQQLAREWPADAQVVDLGPDPEGRP